VSGALGKVIGFFSGLWGRISGAISSIAGRLLAFGSSIIGSLAQGISGAWSKVSSVLGGFGSKVLNALSGAGKLLMGVGTDLIRGLAAGISGSWEAVRRAIAAIVAKIPEPIKKLLGIKSPSTVMRDQVGRWIPLGIAAGITAEGPAVHKALADVVDFRPQPRFAAYTGGVTPGAAASSIVNSTRTVNVYPRAEQSEVAIARSVDRVFGWTEAGA
jgi:phage-related protein